MANEPPDFDNHYNTRVEMPCAGTSRDDKPCKGFCQERYSLGIYAGRWCDGHWKTSGYRDEPASAFDPADCGETYGDEDL